MTRAPAMKIIQAYLKDDFKYLYVENRTQIDEIHMTFQMDSPSYNLQGNLHFQENWLDVLIFISPRPVKVETYGDVLQTVNYVNWYVKAAGRFYIDTYGDLAYSVRLKYEYLQNASLQIAQEIEAAVDYYVDLFPIFIQVCEGEITYKEAMEEIDRLYQ